MGYRYKSLCLDTVEQLHEVIAADCPIVTSDGSHMLVCSPSLTEITMTLDTIPSGTPFTQVYVPQQIPCDTAPAIAEVIELSWLVIGVWVAAWGFKKMSDALRGRS